MSNLISNEQSHLTQTILAELRDLAKTVADDAAQRSKAKKVLTDLVKALEQDDIETASHLATRAQALGAIYPQAQSTFEKLRLNISRGQEEQLRETSTQLEEYCRAHEISLKGSFPKFTIDSFIDLEFDRNRNRTKVGALSLNSLKWSRVREALEAERARIWKRPFNPATYRNRLLAAYNELQQRNPSPVGWAPLEAIYQILKEEEQQTNRDWKKGGRLVAYYKDEFGADLSLLLQAQVSKEIPLPHIELSATRDPRQSFKILQPDHNIGRYGFLRPREGEQ